MADWDVTAAIASLRSLLGDNPTDKFEFKTDLFPTPDGVTTRFFVGQTRLVETSLKVYVGGVLTATSGTPDYETGQLDLIPAPSGSVGCTASFHYQWFRDAELTEFLDAGAQLLSYQAVSGVNEYGIRPALLDFACYYAYMKKAAEFADSLVASAAGYTADQSRSGPNWLSLAKAAFEKAQQKLKIFVEGPLGQASPQMRFVEFRLRDWVPRS